LTAGSDAQVNVTREDRAALERPSSRVDGRISFFFKSVYKEVKESDIASLAELGFVNQSMAA
jgi:hypothetical protein